MLTAAVRFWQVAVEACALGHFNKQLTMEVWDRSGAPQHGAVTGAFWKKCAAALLGFDRTR